MYRLCNSDLKAKSNWTRPLAYFVRNGSNSSKKVLQLHYNLNKPITEDLDTQILQLVYIMCLQIM